MKKIENFSKNKLKKLKIFQKKWKKIAKLKIFQKKLQKLKFFLQKMKN